MLETLAAAANDAVRHKTKVHALIRLLRRIDEPVIVFTEYRDTLFHLRDALRQSTLLLHGGLNRDERSAVLSSFSSGGCRILLATDAAGEGFNLHHRCRLVVNLELPWNPMRLEQRIGRVDRIGQQRAVHAIHLIARDTNEPHILDRLKTRLTRARSELDVPDPVSSEHERRIAALVIGALSRSEEPAAGQSEPLAGCSFPQLTAEAIAEAARLVRIRALSTSADTNAGGNPCIVRARHRTTRARLHGRTLLLLQVVCEDGQGRIAEAGLIPVTLRGVDLRARRDPDSLAALERAIALAVPDVLASWRREASVTVNAFVAARLRRERAIAADARGEIGGLLQGGLFDKRAARAYGAAAARRETDQKAQHGRIHALCRASRLSFQPLRLVLAIAP